MNNTDNAIQGLGIVRKQNRFQLGPLDLLLPRGQVLGMVGPNGSGKTTLINMLLGIIQPDAGTLRVLDTEPERARGALCALPGANHLLPGWSVAQTVAAIRPFYPSWDDNFANALLGQFRLDPTARAKELSSGERSKLSLLLALAPRPQLLILDEPTSGLDPLAREEIIQVIRSFLAEQESSVLFSTHIPADLDGIADRLIALRYGQVAFSGEMETLTETFFAVRGATEQLPWIRDRLIGVRATPMHFEAIVRADSTAGLPPSVIVEDARIDDVVKALAVPLNGETAPRELQQERTKR